MKSKRHEEHKQRVKNRRIVSAMGFAIRKGLDIEPLESRMVDECRHCRWGWK